MPAWTALRAGKIDEARAASKEALRLGTADARLLYHAGMIELGRDHRLAPEAPQGVLVGGEPGRQDLQSDAARRAELLRFVNFAHPPLAEQADDLEVTEADLE